MTALLRTSTFTSASTAESFVHLHERASTAQSFVRRAAGRNRDRIALWIAGGPGDRLVITAALGALGRTPNSPPIRGFGSASSSVLSR